MIATGSKYRQLPAKGADILEHKGLTYCASCDGPLFEGMDVAVIGGGNAAFESAAQLLAYCKTVTLINRSDTFRADEITVEKVLKNPKMSAIKNVEIEKQKRETGLSDEEVLEVLGRAVKQRQDSIRQFEAGGRPDLAENERVELEIIVPYLPAQLSQAEIETVVDEIFATAGQVAAADLGKIMCQVMARLKGKADGNIVREIVKEKLEKIA